jgi:RNA polymerase sigma factor (sigma-70 family)
MFDVEDWGMTFDCAHRLYRHDVFTYALKCGLKHDEAEDLTAQTFMNAFRRWNYRQDGKDPKGYIMVSARNAFIDYLRSAPHRREMVFSQCAERIEDLVFSDDGRQVQELDDRLELQLKLQTYSDENQDLLIRLASGENYKTIAESRKCTPCSLKSRVHRMIPPSNGRKVLGGQNLK